MPVVFISSDIRELKRERAAAISAINDLQFIPDFFEGWPASPKSVQETMFEKVRSSDIYIGIFWRRFSEPTVEEYRMAKRNGKPTLMYVKEKGGSVRDRQLAEFLETVKHPAKGHVYKNFRSSSKLREFIKDSLRVLQGFEIKGRQKPEERIRVIGPKEFNIDLVKSKLEPLLDTEITSVNTRKDLWEDLRNEFPGMGRKRLGKKETDILFEAVDLAIRDMESPEYKKVCIDILSLISFTPSRTIAERIKEESKLIASFNVGMDWGMRKDILAIQRNTTRNIELLTKRLVEKSIHEWNDEEFRNLKGSIKLEDLPDDGREEMYNTLLRLRSKFEIAGEEAKANRAKELAKRLKPYLS